MQENITLGEWHFHYQLVNQRVYLWCVWVWCNWQPIRTEQSKQTTDKPNQKYHKDSSLYGNQIGVIWVVFIASSVHFTTNSLSLSFQRVCFVCVCDSQSHLPCGGIMTAYMLPYWRPSNITIVVVVVVVVVVATRSQLLDLLYAHLRQCVKIRFLLSISSSWCDAIFLYKCWYNHWYIMAMIVSLSHLDTYH